MYLIDLQLIEIAQVTNYYINVLCVYFSHLDIKLGNQNIYKLKTNYHDKMKTPIKRKQTKLAQDSTRDGWSIYKGL